MGGPARVRFRAAVEALGASTLVRLPEEASRQLPSRGQVAVRGSLNGHEFRTVLEPDGDKGHWMRIEPGMGRDAHVGAGNPVTVALEVTPDWPEPELPEDLGQALGRAPATITETWNDITPMARWEWVRWVSATANPGTRRRRIDVTISKLGGGQRRPCCFDRSACTDPTLAKNGKLRRTI